jgi:hypothetical protein
LKGAGHANEGPTHARRNTSSQCIRTRQRPNKDRVLGPPQHVRGTHAWRELWPLIHLRLLTLKEASYLVRLVEMVTCTLVVSPTSQRAKVHPPDPGYPQNKMHAYALFNITFQPDLTMHLDPTSPTIPLVPSVAGASWQRVAPGAITWSAGSPCISLRRRTTLWIKVDAPGTPSALTLKGVAGRSRSTPAQISWADRAVLIASILAAKVGRDSSRNDEHATQRTENASAGSLGVCCAEKVWNEDAMVGLLYQSLRSVSVLRTRT